MRIQVAIDTVVRLARKNQLTAEQQKACEILQRSASLVGALAHMTETYKAIAAWNAQDIEASETDLDTLEGRRVLLETALKLIEHFAKAAEDPANHYPKTH